MTETEEGKQLFLETLANEAVAGVVTIACRRLNRPRATVYDWKNTDKEFSDKWDKIVEEARDVFADEAEYGLRRNVLEGNVSAQIFTLKNLRPTKWKDKREVDTPDGKPIQVEMPGLLDALKKNE